LASANQPRDSFEVPIRPSPSAKRSRARRLTGTPIVYLVSPLPPVFLNRGLDRWSWDVALTRLPLWSLMN